MWLAGWAVLGPKERSGPVGWLPAHAREKGYLFDLFLFPICNREEELKNALATSRSKVRDLELKVREIEAGGLELKWAMKEATDSEYAISQKLADETATRRGLEAKFEVVLKSLQSDQITIAGYEVELNDLKGAVNYAMSCIPVPEEGEQQQSIVDRLIDTPNRLLTLLRATGLADATDALVRVKSHYPDVDMAKIKGGADTTKDLQALELEVDEAANEVMENIDFEGDGGAGGDGGDQ
jgi:chromosome segregation ATPase